MATEFEKDFLPEWCERCDQQGVYFVDDIFEPYLVVCSHCGREALSVWCPECEAGFALPNEGGNRAFSWSCPICQAEYPLPETMYAKPVRLYLEDELPEDVRARVAPTRKAWNATAIAVTVIAVAVLIFACWLLS